MTVTSAPQARYHQESERGAGTRIHPFLRWALCLVALSIPLEFPDRFWFEVSTLAGASFLLCTLIQPRACYAQLPWALACYALYLMTLMVSFVTRGALYPGGLYPAEVTKFMLLQLLWVLFFWASSNLLREERIYKIALWSLIVGCAVRAALPLVGLSRTAHVEGSGGERVTALGQNPNQSAQVLALGLIALIGLTLVQPQGTRRPRVLAATGGTLIALGLVQTGSRGGLLVLCIGLVTFVLSGPTLRVRVRNGAVALIGLGMMFFLITRSELMQARLERAAVGDLAKRENVFPTLLGMFQEAPLLGWGPITNKYELASRLGDSTHGRRDAHNIILEILTSAGVIGALCFLLGVWFCLRSANTARAGPRGVVPLTMLLALLVGNMSENRIAGPLLWMVLAVGLASGRAGASLRMARRPPR